MYATTEYTTDGLVLHPDALRAVAMFVGASPIQERIYLDEEGHLSATNGHALIRLCSILPGGQVPADRSGLSWSPTTVGALLESVPKIRHAKKHAEQHAQQRVLLRWDTRLPKNEAVPKTVHILEAAREIRVVSERRAIAIPYLRMLADASELLIGRAPLYGDQVAGYAPILLNSPGELDPHYYGIPWYQHNLSAKSTSAKFSAEMIVMPMRSR